MRIDGSGFELFLQLLAQPLINEVLDAVGRFVDVVERQAEVAVEVRFPQAVRADELAGLLAARGGKVEAVARGIDMFDCVMPTRNGRNGMLFTTEGIINIKNKKWEDDFSCIDPGLDNFASLNYSKAYIRHLFAAGELLGLELASLQNLAF